MDIHVSAEVLEGLKQARARDLRDSKRLRIVVGDKFYPVLRNWDGGFALEAESTPHLRGTVEFCNGADVLYEALIFCSELDGREMRYEYKRKTPAVDKAPVDFVKADDAPVALLTK